MTTIDALTKFSKNINALHDFPQESSQEDFTNLMTRSFRGMYSPIKYYFNPTLNRHTVRLRDWPQISIDIIWTNTTEVAIKLTNFLKSIENCLYYLVGMEKIITDVGKFQVYLMIVDI